MKLWLVRHAQPLIAPGLCYGSTDVAAEEGATLLAAQVLAGVLPRGLVVICSPLQRCERLAHVLQGLRPDLTYKTDGRLVEMDFGCWEKQRWDSIPQADFERWTNDFANHRFGGRESVADVMRRVGAAWDENQRAGQNTVWITHAGVIRAASLLSQGVREVSQAADWPQQAPAFGGWCALPIKADAAQ